jgi:hypothetical protein
MKSVASLRAPFCLVAALLAPVTSAQTTLSVDANQTIRTIDDRLFGINAVMWDPNTATAPTIDRVKAAGLRIIRIPGGSVSDEYHWAINRSLSNTWSWSAGMDKFAALITGANTQATVIVNYGTGTPEEAAAWVAYANAPANLQGTAADVPLGIDARGVDWHTAGFWSALRAATPLATNDGSNFLRLGRSTPLGFKYWEIGNECYGSWETDQQAVPHDPYTYALRTKDYIAKMRAVDPTIKIGVVVSTGEDQYANNTSHPATNPRTGRTHNGWTPVLLSTLKSIGVTPDSLIYHRYEQTPGQESDATLLQMARTWPNDAADLRQQLTDYMGAAGAAVELQITENNSVFSNPGKQSTSLVNGLFYADAFGSVLQTEFNSYLWWALRNGPPTANGVITGNMSASLYGWRQFGDYGVISTPTTGGATTYDDAYPVYYMMKLVSHFARAGDTVIRATSSSNLLAAYAVKRLDGTLTLLVINKSPTDDTTANVSLAGFVPGSTATVYSYGVPQDEAARTGTGVNDVTTTTVSNAGATFAMTFPHYSATVVSLAQSAPQIVAQPQAQTVVSGGSVIFSVLATGTPTPTYQWLKNGVAISGATSATLTLTHVSATDAGTYTVTATNSAGAVTSSGATLTVASASNRGRIINMSVLTSINAGETFTFGYYIGGDGTSGTKPILMRAMGPTLGAPPFNLGGTLPDPLVEFFNGDAKVGQNDNWNGDSSLRTAVTAVQAFPFVSDSSKDAAIYAPAVDASTGHSIRVSGVGSSSGTVIAELYDATPSDQYTTTTPRLVNVSLIKNVGAVTTLGFYINGATSANVLIRAVGPSIAPPPFNVPGTMADPKMALYSQADTSTPLATNDDWQGAPQLKAAFDATGAFGLNDTSKDAALVRTLPPGGYSVQVSPATGSTGVALIEVYELP